MPLEVRPGGQGTTLISRYCGLVCLTLVTFLAAERWLAGAKPQENGGDIPPQIVTRAETICRQLNPNAGEVEMTELGQGDAAAGPTRARWSVACTVSDRSLNFIFDRPTGSLILCSQMGREAESGETSIRNAKTAERMGRRYLRVLELEGKGSIWQLSCSAEGRANSWLVRFHRRKRHLYIILDSWTGDLLLLKQDKPALYL